MIKWSNQFLVLSSPLGRAQKSMWHNSTWDFSIRNRALRIKTTSKFYFKEFYKFFLDDWFRCDFINGGIRKIETTTFVFFGCAFFFFSGLGSAEHCVASSASSQAHLSPLSCFCSSAHIFHRRFGRRDATVHIPKGPSPPEWINGIQQIIVARARSHNSIRAHTHLHIFNGLMISSSSRYIFLVVNFGDKMR